jgi:RHS repeat-associated protein
MTSDAEIATLDEDLTIKDLFFSGADGLISSTTSEGTSYYSCNPHSDASLITDAAGNTTSQLHYDAWGNTVETTTEPNNYLGKFQRRDYSSPNLIKMGARFYDPSTGRFISRDPLRGTDGLPISHNPYVYANDDPVNVMDLTGMGLGDAAESVKTGALDLAEDAKKFATTPAQPAQKPNCPDAGDYVGYDMVTGGILITTTGLAVIGAAVTIPPGPFVLPAKIIAGTTGVVIVVVGVGVTIWGFIESL